jgi:hypothetical protein
LLLSENAWTQQGGVMLETNTEGDTHDLTAKAQTVAQEARQSFARLIEEQPILMTALGAALGAAVGAALPLSQAEKDLIGESGSKAIDIGRGALANAADAVRKEAASVDLGATICQLADQVVRTVTKEAVKPE